MWRSEHDAAAFLVRLARRLIEPISTLKTIFLVSVLVIPVVMLKWTIGAIFGRGVIHPWAHLSQFNARIVELLDPEALYVWTPAQEL